MTDKEELRGGMLLAIHKQQRSHSCWRQNCVTIFIENLSCLVDTGPSSTGSRFIWCCMGEGHERISAPGHCKTSFRGGDSAYEWLGFQFSWFATQVSHTKLVSADAFPFSRVQFTSLCWAHPHFPGIHFSVTLIPHILGILIDLRSKWPKCWTPSVVMVGLYLYLPQSWQLGCGFMGGTGHRWQVGASSHEWLCEAGAPTYTLSQAWRRRTLFMVLLLWFLSQESIWNPVRRSWSCDYLIRTEELYRSWDCNNFSRGGWEDHHKGIREWYPVWRRLVALLQGPAVFTYDLC